MDGVDAELRARVLTEIATRFQELGHHDQCADLVSAAEIDAPAGDQVRSELAAIKPRAVGGCAGVDSGEGL